MNGKHSSTQKAVPYCKLFPNSDILLASSFPWKCYSWFLISHVLLLILNQFWGGERAPTCIRQSDWQRLSIMSDLPYELSKSHNMVLNTICFLIRTDVGQLRCQTITFFSIIPFTLKKKDIIYIRILYRYSLKVYLTCELDGSTEKQCSNDNCMYSWLKYSWFLFTQTHNINISNYYPINLVIRPAMFCCHLEAVKIICKYNIDIFLILKWICQSCLHLCVVAFGHLVNASLVFNLC